MKVFALVELDPREQAFVGGVAIYGYSATRAASEAGYTKSAARALLAKVHIRAALSDISTNVTTCLRKWERKQAKRAA